MAGRVLPIVLLCLANSAAAGESKVPAGRAAYRFENA